MDITHIHTIEYTITLVMISFEDDDILEDLIVDPDTVIVTNGIFTQEVEHKRIRGIAGDVLEPQRATTNSVSLVVALLITRSKCKFVDEVHCSSTLTNLSDLRLELRGVIGANTSDVFLE